MAKRGAETDLNHDNWNDEYQSEEAGVFQKAPKSILSTRNIKVARRRSNNLTSSPASSPFANFGGFKPQSEGTPKPKVTFDLTSSSSTPTTNGGDKTAMFSFSTKPNIPNFTQDIGKETATNSSEDEYVANLTSLNKKVSEWIQLHVDKNPLCILTPVFDDYNRFLKEIRNKRQEPETNNAMNKGKSPLLLFNATQDKETTNNKAICNTGSTSSLQSTVFGNVKTDLSNSVLFKKPDPASLMVNPFTAKPVNSAEKSNDSTKITGTSATKPFVFGTRSEPFKFINVTAPLVKLSNETGEQDEEAEEPPKADFKPVQEDDALFSKRCKVFVKKDSNYADRGVGTLYVKKVGDGKYQLLVRADTVLGNILVNVLLSSSVPIQRMGKNNVMLICLPTPDTAPPPTPVLLRVKTSEEADDLLKTLEQYQN